MAWSPGTNRGRNVCSSTGCRPPGMMQASDPVVRHLIAGVGSIAASDFVRGRPVPLTYTREIPAKTFVGSLPPVRAVAGSRQLVPVAR